MKRGWLKCLFLIAFVLLIFQIYFVSSASVEDDMHLNVQVRDSSGNIETGTFVFGFNISTSSGCTVAEDVVFANATTQTTDARGIVSYYLQDVSLNFTDQYYLCYYRDGSLKSASQLARVPYAFNSKFLNGYSSSAFFPFNTSVTGDFDFNSGWENGGVSIRGGSIYADTGFFYNLSKLNLTSLNVNGSILPQAGFDDTFDLGAPTLRWRDLWLSRNVNVSGTATVKSIVSYDWTNISHILLYNHTSETFNAYNSTWDNRYLIADVETALSNNITSVNSSRNIQSLINDTMLQLSSLNVTGTSYLGNIIIDADNITTNNILTKAGNITFWNLTRGEVMRITNKGNIGIGTDNPTHKLQISNGNLMIENIDPSNAIFLNNTDSTNGLGLRWINSDTSNWIFFIPYPLGVADFDKEFGYNFDFGAWVLVKNGGIGSVFGIGTTTPSNTLDVRGQGNFSGTIYINNVTDISTFSTTGFMRNTSAET